MALDRLQRLHGKVALITGGGAGIGRACCELFAAEGAQIVVAEINPQTGKSVVQSIEQAGGRAVFTHCDVASESDVAAATEFALTSYGTIDILVNNAGIEMFKSALETSLSDWDRCVNVDLRGVWLCSKYALPTMLAKGKGAIVNISSVHAVQTMNNIAAYAASKGGVLAMTRNMALDYAPAVRINTILPGYIATTLWDRYVTASADPEKLVRETTALQPMQRLGQSHDIAQSALFLASDEASWITGTSLVVDGGLTARLHN